MSSHKKEDILNTKLHKSLSLTGKYLFTIVQDVYHLHPDSKAGTVKFCDFARTKRDGSIYGTYEDVERICDINSKNLSNVYELFNICKINYPALDEFMKSEENTLKKINAIRNKVSKHYFKDEKNIEALKDDLMRHTRESCIRLGEIVQKEQEYKENLHSHLEFIREIWEWKSDANEHKEIFFDEFLKTKSVGRDELIQRFEHLSTDPFAFLNLSSLQKKFTECCLEEKGQKMNYMDIFTRNSHEDSLIVAIIEGYSGSGKTTLCRFYLKEWAKNASELSERYVFMIYINLNEILESEVRISNLLMKLMPNTFGESDEGSILAMIRNMNVLFLVDDFNLGNTNGVKLVKDVFQKFGTVNTRILITTQNNSSLKAYLGNENIDCRCLFLRGFLSKERVAFIQHSPQKKLHKASSCSYYPYMEDIMALPAFSIINFCQDSNMNSLTKFQFCLLETLAKNFARNENLEVKALEKGIFPILWREAYRIYKSNLKSKILSEQSILNIKDAANKVNISGTRFLENFFRSYKALSGLESYEFICKSQMEYFVARYLLHNFKNFDEIRNFLQECEDTDKYVIYYLAALLPCNDDLRQLLSSELGPLKINHFWRLLREVKYYRDCKDLSIDELFKSRLPQEWKLDQSDVVSGLNMIRHYGLSKIEKLDIKISEDVDPYHIEGFLESIGELRSLSLPSKTVPMTLELNFHTLHSVKDKSSSVFLKKLNGWNSLIVFSGSINSYDSMRYHSNLEKVKVRICDFSVYSQFAKNINSIKRLKSIHLILDFPHKSEGRIQYFKLNKSCEFNLSFINLSEENLGNAVDFISTICRENVCQELSLEGALQFNSIQNKLTLDKESVEPNIKYLLIKSRISISSKKKSDLRHKYQFKVDWVS